MSDEAPRQRAKAKTDIDPIIAAGEVEENPPTPLLQGGANEPLTTIKTGQAIVYSYTSTEQYKRLRSKLGRQIKLYNEQLKIPKVFSLIQDHLNKKLRLYRLS